MRILGFDHVQVAITAGAESAARQFYGEVLGLTEVEKPATLADRGGVWFKCGTQQLHCGVEPEVARTRRHAALLTDDLEAIRSRLVRAGIATSDDRQIPGYRRFYAEDPFGNRLEFMQPLNGPI
ncbi:MAG: VOC family protein [Candidatus Dormibacteraeota bacterium]|nr:VOC family protein [Candidatus Dormibacteraeota bacterium]